VPAMHDGQIQNIYKEPFRKSYGASETMLFYVNISRNDGFPTILSGVTYNSLHKGLSFLKRQVKQKRRSLI